MPNIVLDQRQLTEFCKRHFIRKLALFGSVIREDFGPDSDVDVLAEFEQGHVPGFLRLAAMEQELSALLGGRRVDLRTPQALSRYFRDEVVVSASVLCAQG